MAARALEDPDDADLPTGSRMKNMHITAHLYYRPGGELIIGGEFRRIGRLLFREDHGQSHQGFGEAPSRLWTPGQSRQVEPTSR